ncbi:hypothetical protein [Flaviaesturariibacter terrae]
MGMRNREQKERNEAAGPRRPQDDSRRRGEGDFWDRVADDVARGYGAQQRGRDRNILNPDQEPDDARRGDS